MSDEEKRDCCNTWDNGNHRDGCPEDTEPYSRPQENGVSDEDMNEDKQIAVISLKAIAENGFMVGAKKALQSLAYEFVEDGFHQGFNEGYKARDARSGWVAIEDIPEEWKGGRPVDIWVDDGAREPFRLNNCRHKNRPIAEGYSNWKSWNYALKEGTAKFAMLPPQPPSQAKKKD